MLASDLRQPRKAGQRSQDAMCLTAPLRFWRKGTTLLNQHTRGGALTSKSDHRNMW